MSKLKDLTGRRFGMLTVVQRDFDSSKRTRWLCDCDCGTKNKSVLSTHLLRGKISSCGCTKCLKISKAKLRPPTILYDENGMCYFCVNNQRVDFDIEDIDIICKHSWHIQNNGYVAGAEQGKIIYLHRAIMKKYFDLSADDQVDHINGNRLVCYKSNMRIVTQQQNSYNLGLQKRNKTGYKGIYRSRNGKWYAQITKDKHTYSLGTYNTIEEAIYNRKIAANQMFGTFNRQEDSGGDA